jgi:plastocyanin domain-containing protein
MLKRAWWLSVVVLIVAGCAGQPAGKAAPPGAIAINVTEKGFEPASARVRQGVPVTLLVTRETDRTCAKEIVLAEYGIRRELPLGQAVEITFTPRARGTLRYACGMDMIAGQLIVE